MRISFACLMLLIASSIHAKPLHVSLILSDSNLPYRLFADVLKSKLLASKAEVDVAESMVVEDRQRDLIIAVGLKAAVMATAQSGTPVLVAMIPEENYRELAEQRTLAGGKRMLSAIYLDQPLGRRMDFMRATLPGKPRVGLLYSQGANIDIDGLHKEFERRGVTLVARQLGISDRLVPVLDALLADSDVLFGMPDRAIYGGGNIRNIMLASYRRNVPMVGISKAYVTAGALCAVFSTPEQLAAQTGEAVVAFAQSRQLGTPQYPADFSIELNLPVARSLGINLPTPEVIRARMKLNAESSR
jgi:ABC-type uncharacterized transport system substrate-binding protein